MNKLTLTHFVHETILRLFSIILSLYGSKQKDYNYYQNYKYGANSYC